MKLRSKYDFQPIREIFMALAIVCLVAGWWISYRCHVIMEPVLYMETSLVLVIAAEAFARDE